MGSAAAGRESFAAWEFSAGAISDFSSLCRQGALILAGLFHQG
jgi:hypothetical protein